MAGKIALGRVQTGTFTGDRMQAQARSASVKVNGLPFVGGWTVVKAVAFTAATARDVTHGLNSTDIGYFIVRSYGTNPVDLNESGTAADPASSRRLVSSATGTADVLFFRY